MANDYNKYDTMKDIFGIFIEVGDVVAFVHKYNRYFDLEKGKVVKTTEKMVFVEFYNSMYNQKEIVKVVPYKCVVMRDDWYRIHLND
jgi:hypothetical protein